MNEPGSQNNRPPGPDNKQNSPRQRLRIPNWLIIAVLISITLWYAYVVFWPGDSATKINIPYSAMVTAVEADQVNSVEIKGQSVNGEFVEPLKWTGQELLLPDEPVPAGTDADDITESQDFASTIPLNTEAEFSALLLENGVTATVNEEGQSLFPEILISLLPLAIFLAVLIFIGRNMMRGQQNVFKFGSSKAKMHDMERPQITFEDMAGEEEAKTELSEVVDFLKNPIKYHAIGAKLPRGVLLVGPPGTGKTLLARAVAGEAGVPFFSVSASEFVEMFVGVGASRVRDLFNKAKEASPSIVFVDELDAVGRQRFAGLGGSNDEREQTLNQLLVEMDGFDDRQEVIVLAATNRPDVLDPALLRPGRFDRQVTIGLPDRKVRAEVLKIHSRGIPMDDSVVLDSIAGGTPGFSGADLANLVNEAALTAARHDRKVVTKVDFDLALDKIILGTARSVLVNEQERLVVAYHEAGHAIVAHFSPGADPLRKVSIVPRGQALGVTIVTPEEDRHNYSRQFLLDRMAMMMGGRAAEKMIFDEITTGAQGDLKSATDLARRMVGIWGMSDEIGLIYLGSGEENVFLGREITQQQHVGDTTQDQADGAVRKMLDQAMERATSLLTKHRDELDRLAERLIIDETLDEDDVTLLIGAPPVPAAIAMSQRTDV